jgi:hypothetical protein
MCALGRVSVEEARGRSKAGHRQRRAAGGQRRRPNWPAATRISKVEGEQGRPRGSNRSGQGRRSLWGGLVNHLAGDGEGRTQPEETDGAAATRGRSGARAWEERNEKWERRGWASRDGPEPNQADLVGWARPSWTSWIRPNYLSFIFSWH